MNHSNKSVLEVVNGYGCLKTSTRSEKISVNRVFIKKSEDDFCTLLITFLPSKTVSGILEKSLFISTIWLTLLTASFPLAIAIEQSASLSAKISLTPSPVIATVLPSFLIVLIKSAFCSGVTLPNTVYLFAAAITCFSLSPSRLINESVPSTPTLFAISETVRGLSPEIIFTFTLLFLNQLIVFAAFSRMWSSSTIIAIGSFLSGMVSFTIEFGECAKSKIL